MDINRILFNHILNYDACKLDGTIPSISIGKFCSIAQNITFIACHHDIIKI